MIVLLLRFCSRLLLLIICLFLLHTIAADRFGLSVQGNILKVCYLFNTLITLAFFLLLLFVSKHNPTILGWVFLLTTGIKFLLFFTLIYPSFQRIGMSRAQEFLSFFIPYVAALTLEIYELIKILNRKN